MGLRMVQVKKNCLNYGKEIKVKPSHFDRKKYCSRACKSDYQKKNPPQFWKEMSKKLVVFCSYCQTSILKKPSEIRNHNFCNHQCKRLYQVKKGHLINQHLRKSVLVTCKFCRKIFIVPQNREHTAKYCSKNCLGKANGERGRVQYKKTIKVTCTNCSKDFEKKAFNHQKVEFLFSRMYGYLLFGKSNVCW